jgi:Flp pilus assembly protein TadD
MRSPSLKHPAGRPQPATDAAALHQQSLESVKQKKFKEAVDYADQATKADPTKPEYFSQLGVALSQRMSEVNFLQMAALSGRMRKAFEKSIELDPNHVLRPHRPRPASTPTRRRSPAAAWPRRPSSPPACRRSSPSSARSSSATSPTRTRNTPEALAHYETAASLRPTHAGVQAGCGRVLMKLGRKDEARARFEAALKLNPEHEGAKKSLAELDATADKKT